MKKGSSSEFTGSVGSEYHMNRDFKRVAIESDLESIIKLDLKNPSKDIFRDLLYDHELKLQSLIEEFNLKLVGLFSAPQKQNNIVKRKRTPIQKKSREHLKKWLEDHKSNPYPSEEEKLKLEQETGLSRLQIDNCNYVNTYFRVCKW